MKTVNREIAGSSFVKDYHASMKKPVKEWEETIPAGKDIEDRPKRKVIKYSKYLKCGDENAPLTKRRLLRVEKLINKKWVRVG